MGSSPNSERQEMNKPHRRFECNLEVSADSIDDLCGALNNIIFSIKNKETRRCVSGGCTSGYILAIEEDKNMTHEQFIKDLKLYLEKEQENEW